MDDVAPHWPLTPVGLEPGIINATVGEAGETTWFNIHESSSSLILSVFYTVIISTIRIIIIIII